MAKKRKKKDEEVVANCDNLRSLKFYPSLPFAYTEQGIGQLSTVVHSKIAIERSIMIMNAFVAMRRFMVQNAGILMRIAHLEKHQIETDQKMDMILDRMDKQSPKLLPEQIFGTGCVWDAWTYVSDLVRSAKQRIVLIDNFVDDVYFLGASVKDMGVGLCAVKKLQASPETILQLLK